LIRPTKNSAIAHSLSRFDLRAIALRRGIALPDWIPALGDWPTAHDFEAIWRLHQEGAPEELPLTVGLVSGCQELPGDLRVILAQLPVRCEAFELPASSGEPVPFGIDVVVIAPDGIGASNERLHAWIDEGGGALCVGALMDAAPAGQWNFDGIAPIAGASASRIGDGCCVALERFPSTHSFRRWLLEVLWALSGQRCAPTCWSASEVAVEAAWFASSGALAASGPEGERTVEVAHPQFGSTQIRLDRDGFGMAEVPGSKISDAAQAATRR